MDILIIDTLRLINTISFHKTHVRWKKKPRTQHNRFYKCSIAGEKAFILKKLASKWDTVESNDKVLIMEYLDVTRDIINHPRWLESDTWTDVQDLIQGEMKYLKLIHQVEGPNYQTVERDLLEYTMFLICRYDLRARAYVKRLTGTIQPWKSQLKPLTSGNYDQPYKQTFTTRDLTDLIKSFIIWICSKFVDTRAELFEVLQTINTSFPVPNRPMIPLLKTKDAYFL